MTEQERIQRCHDLQEMINSKGYRWLVKKFDELIKDDQDTFLMCDTDQDRFKKQIRLQLIGDLRSWAQEEVDRVRSIEKMKK